MTINRKAVIRDRWDVPDHHTTERHADGCLGKSRWCRKGIFTLVMQVLGLAYDSIKSRTIKALGKNGEKMFNGLEKTFEVFVILKNEGLAGLWQFIQDKVGDLKVMVIDTIQNFVIESVIKQGVLWVISLLNPASAFAKACKMIYDIIMFFIERGSQIVELVNAVMESVTAIANGALGGAAKLIENALSKALPVVISFMASLLGLGGISKKVGGIIKQVRAPIDWLIAQAVKFAKKIGKKLGFGKDKKGKDGKPDERTDEQKQADLELALGEADTLARSKQPEKELKASLAAIKAKYKMTVLEVVIDKHGPKEDVVHVHGEINPSLSFPPFTRPTVGWKLASGGLKDHENKILASGKDVHLFTRHGENVAEVDMEAELEQRREDFKNGQTALINYYKAQVTSISNKITLEQKKGRLPTDQRLVELHQLLTANQTKCNYWQNVDPTDRAAVAAASATREWRGKVAGGPRKPFEANKTRFSDNGELEGAVLTTVKNNESNINTELTANPTKEVKVTSTFPGNLGIGYELDASMNVVKLNTPLTKVSAIIRSSDVAKQEYMVQTAWPHA